MTINPAYLSTEGKLWLQLKSLEGKPVFGDLAQRRELLSCFAKITGSELPETAADGWPSIPLALIAADPQGIEKVIAALNWMLEQVRAAG